MIVIQLVALVVGMLCAAFLGYLIGHDKVHHQKMQHIDSLGRVHVAVIDLLNVHDADITKVFERLSTVVNQEYKRIHDEVK